MIARIAFAWAVVVLAPIMGCGTAPPEVSETSSSVSELLTGLRESGERQQQAINALQNETEDLKNQLKMLEQNQAAKATEIKIQLRNFDLQLEKALERFNKLPVETKLQMRFPGRIKGPLEEALAELSEWTTIPIHFEPGDLREAGIARIHDVELIGGNVSAGKLLADALRQTNHHRVSSLADPLLNVVYVIQNAGDLGNESLLITSRKRAAQRGKLPDEFAIQKKPVPAN